MEDCFIAKVQLCEYENQTLLRPVVCMYAGAFERPAARQNFALLLRMILKLTLLHAYWILYPLIH